MSQEDTNLTVDVSEKDENQQSDQVVEATSSTESTVEIDVDDIDSIKIDDELDIDALKNRLDKEAQARRELTIRAKKAENELKNLKKGSQNREESFSEEFIEAKILKAQGMKDDLLSELKVISKLRKKSLLECQNDPIFLKLKEAKQEEEKSFKSKIGASKNTGVQRREKDFTSSNLSPEDHKKMWREFNRK